MTGERAISVEAVLEDASVILDNVEDPKQLATSLTGLWKDLEERALKAKEENPGGESLAGSPKRYYGGDFEPERNALRLNSDSIYVVGPVGSFGARQDGSAHALVQEFPYRFGKFVKVTFWPGKQDYELSAVDVLIARRVGLQGMILESNTRIGIANGQASVIETIRRPSVQ